MLIARMHAHRIDVLNRADDDKVIRGITHDLELEFLPPDHGFLNQDFVNGAHLEATLDQLAKLLDGCTQYRHQPRPA